MSEERSSGSAGASVGDGADAATLLAMDRAARAEAQTRFDRPLVLEAGAGTGKTTTLIARLLAWCLGVGWDKAATPAAGRYGAAAVAAEAMAGDPVVASRAPPAKALSSEAIAARVLRRVVALTFTEAAAAEMASRAARELAGLAAGGAPPAWLAAASLPPVPELAGRARALLATLDQLAVQTIHAYCLGLLSAWPLEAGVHPRLQVDADGRLLEQVISETVEAALRPGYGAPGDPHLLALAAQGCGPREVADALATLAAAGLPARALLEDPFAGDGWASLRGRLAATCTDLRDLLAPRLGGSQLRNATAILRALERLSELSQRPGDPEEMGTLTSSQEGSLDLDLAAVQREIEALLPANLRSRLGDWSRGRLRGQQEQARLSAVRAELAVAAASLQRLLAHVAALDPERLRHGRLALAPLLATVESELRRRGIATFDSLLRGARRLLLAHPEVRAKLRRGIDQLLVDEFQDTDATQCDVLRWMALEGPPGERPGLFLVGDPKQSIYGWRNADLRAYEGFVTRLRAAGGEVLPLVENFRSVPAILDEVARVMVPVMRARRGVQPDFTPLLACERRLGDPGFAVAGRAPVEYWVSWLPDAGEPGKGDGPARPLAPAASAAAELEAEVIAADLAELHERHGVPWRDAAILLRGTGDLDTYLDALRRAGIPFAVGRDKQYYRRREIIDAAALVRAVLDPGDHLALVTLLRAPVVGVPDAALLPLWRHQLPQLLTELHEPSAQALAVVRQAVEAAAGQLPEGVPGLDRVQGWELSLLAAVEHLAVLRRSFLDEPADLFVERLRRLLLLDVTAAARYLGGYRLANLDRFFRQLLAEIEQGSGDVMAVLRALRDSVADGREAEEGRPPEGAGDAVQVLTMHGAKGLDFPHVYLPQLHKPAGGDRAAPTAAGRLEAADGEPPAPYEYRLLGAATPGFDRLEERRAEVEAAERVRTLYVAMTRAKDRLVLLGVWPPGAGPMLPEEARTHLQLLACRPGCPDLQRLWRESLGTAASGGAAAPESLGQPEAGAERATEDGSVAWRFPAFARRTLAPDGAAGTGGLAQPAEVAAQAARLAEWRATAALRMQRPWSAAASDEAHAQLREEVAVKREENPRPGDLEIAGEPGAAGPADRDLAMAAGAALHRALELWDLEAVPEREVERQRGLLPAYLAAVAEGEEVRRALPRCVRLLGRFAANGLAARLRRLAGSVVAREMPVLLAPPARASTAAEPGPVGFVSGAVDLLYRDPATGELVIADYKTDEVAGADLARRAATYASQGAVYALAVREALDLTAPPRFEVWFVHSGEVVAVPPPG